MTLALYANFSKKVNSTKFPPLDYNNKLTVNAFMKENTSIENPVFKIYMQENFNYQDVNYCETAGHYYFVDDVILGNRNIIELHCTTDVLATWKSYIVTTEQYIIRSSNSKAYSQGDTLPDILAAVKPYDVKGSIVNPVIDEGVTYPVFSLTNGFYILGFIAEAPNSSYPWQATSLVDYRGSVAYMLMTETQLRSFMNSLLSLDAGQADIQPKDFISSVLYIPYALNVTGQPIMTFRMEFSGNEFTFEYTSVNGIASINRGIYSTSDTDFDVPLHPDTTSRGHRMNLEPFTRLLFHGGPYGDIQIPNDIFYNGYEPELILKQKIDLCTGVGTLRFYNKYNGYEFMRINGQVGLNIRISQLYTRSKAQDLSLILGLAGALGKTVAGVASGDLGEAVGATAGALKDTVMGGYTGNLPKVSTTGNNDSLIDYVDSWTLEAIWHTAIPENLPENGRPVYKRLVINDYPGYIQCNNFAAEIPCHLSEYQRIVEYANTGFYYE